MGRRRIPITRIADDRNRSVTFNKRRAGLFKKSYELGVLCGADIAVIIFSPSGKCYEYSSGNLDETLLRYSRMSTPPTERKGPVDFGELVPHAVSFFPDAGVEHCDGDGEDAWMSSDLAHQAAKSAFSDLEMRGYSPTIRSVSYEAAAVQKRARRTEQGCLADIPTVAEISTRNQHPQTSDDLEPDTPWPQNISGPARLHIEGTMLPTTSSTDRAPSAESQTMAKVPHSPILTFRRSSAPSRPATQPIRARQQIGDDQQFSHQLPAWIVQEDEVAFEWPQYDRLRLEDRSESSIDLERDHDAPADISMQRDTVRAR